MRRVASLIGGIFWRGAMIKHHHRVALYLGWLAGGLAMLGAHLFDASGWPITAAVALTSFAVALAAVRWPFV
jgi:hypothetical protein